MDAQTIARALKVPGLTASQVRVLALLADHANDSGRAWPRRELLASEGDMTEDGVKKATRRLADLGYITRESGGHNGRTTVWQVHPDLWPGPRRGDTRTPNGDVEGTPVPPTLDVGGTHDPSRGYTRPRKGVHTTPPNYSRTTQNPSAHSPRDLQVRDELVAQGWTTENAEQLVHYALDDPKTTSPRRLLADPRYLSEARTAIQADHSRQAAHDRNDQAAHALADLESDPRTGPIVAQVRGHIPNAPPALLLLNVRQELRDGATA